MTPEISPGCLERIPQWGRQLARNDELAQHRAVRALIDCEATAPVAFAAAPGLDAVTRGIEQSAIAQEKLARELGRLGPTLGGALLATTMLPAADSLFAAQRWYDEAGRWEDGAPGVDEGEPGGADAGRPREASPHEGARCFAERAADAVRRAATNAQLKAATLSEPERRDASFAAEALFNQVSRESGAALVPPPETPAQARIREACGVTLRDLCGMLASRGGPE